ncbi:zinc finger and SCAN domain-containing protein 2-like isoform X9 [Ruditapes philippinarum]|uniref:zinc finger and SCAN domain-containing protein 2-like isoform X9 n=1 Tax=Ruditapes philippinarum TaxID=129788 RepID=UPI00295A7376|nr:zinc finger and SCAN domain-containing protein 2-like isoform X9 [Ruditapes philippinarum]
MAAPDYDVIKEIPGYKVILKAVLKSQIQQLVEQLATSTDEESVILTASVADGTLSHLGSDSGKGFLEDHEDIKSQFLGFCLKKHHRKKQEEKERLEAEALQQSLQASPVRFGGPRGPYGPRSPRFASPRGQGPIHPVALTRASPGQLRHQPYPMTRPPKLKRPPLNFDPGRSPVGMPSHSPMRSPTANKLDGQIIKIEPDDSNEASNQSENETGNQDNSDNASQSPSHAANAPSSVKSESGEKDDDARSESSNSTIPNEPPAEGLSLDSDLSNLISGNNQEQSSETTSEMDPNVSVKLEALTENEMDLEITGVEPGRPMVPQDNWDPNVSMGMNYDPTGATGNQGDMSAQGYISHERGHHITSTQDGEPEKIQTYGQTRTNRFYTSNPNARSLLDGNEASIQPVRMKSGMTTGQGSRFQCQYCEKAFPYKSKLDRHVLLHTGETPFHCEVCGKGFKQKRSLLCHRISSH